MGRDRFVKTYSQGIMDITEIWVDRQTGVNYLFHAGGNAGGLTPLLDRAGNPCDHYGKRGGMTDEAAVCGWVHQPAGAGVPDPASGRGLFDRLPGRTS